jgi:hypothetical protein
MATFVTVNQQINPVYSVADKELVLRPYNETLSNFTAQVCSEIGGTATNECKFELRVAFDCLLRNKVRKFGAFNNNLGACSHHINAMKENVANGYSLPSDKVGGILDGYLDEIANMRRSFV